MSEPIKQSIIGKQRVSEKIKHASSSKNNKNGRNDSDGKQKVRQRKGGLAKAESLTKEKKPCHMEIYFITKRIRLHIGHITAEPCL